MSQLKRYSLSYRFTTSIVQSETELGLLCLSTAESAYSLGNAVAGREAVDRGLAACDRASEVVAKTAESQRELLALAIRSLRHSLNRLLNGQHG